ncbi:MAG TPA: histidine phosphatase family protein [Opitutaceae bacterium]|nr:histidine phosphatase family protein [Opitutaceae bacterium]
MRPPSRPKITFMVAQIFLIRHGETQWSRTGQHTGRTDLPLTENGERQASHLRGLLQATQFTHVLTSPLLRARRTCELAGFAAVARVEPDLHEWDYGDYEGRTSAEIHALQPGWNVFQDGCPRGESVEQISRRADRVLAGLRPLDGTVALFSHGHFLRALAVRWIGLPLKEGQHFGLDTASLSILGHERPTGENPVISLWNSSNVQR